MPDRTKVSREFRRGYDDRSPEPEEAEHGYHNHNYAD